MFTINKKVTLQTWPFVSGTRKHDFLLIQKLIIAKADPTPTPSISNDELFLNAGFDHIIETFQKTTREMINVSTIVVIHYFS